MIHVVFVLDSAAFGGAEACVAHLAAHLPEGHRCTVLAAEPVPQRLAELLDGCAPLATVAPVGARWRRLPAVRRALCALRPDVVHVNLIDLSSNRVLVAAALASGATTVATVHLAPDGGDGRRRQMVRVLFRRLDAVIAVSQQVAASVRDVGVHRGRVHVLDNGVPPVERPVRTEHRDGPVRIGAVGRLTRQKGFDVLLRAVAMLTADGAGVDLVIAGVGREGGALRQAAAGLPVRFLGFVEDVPALLATVDVFCLPSRAEGLPLALLEALMAGVPAVATAVGAIPAAVGDAAVLVPPEDATALAGALRRLVDSPARRAALAARGRARAFERFTATRMAQETAAVWSSAMGCPRAVSPRRGGTRRGLAGPEPASRSGPPPVAPPTRGARAAPDRSAHGPARRRSHPRLEEPPASP